MEKGSPAQTEAVIDLGDGLLMPAPVNVHTHLELSSPSLRTTLGKGFIPWVISLIVGRARMSQQEVQEARRIGIERMEATGTALVGDVCNSRETAQELARASFSSWSFLEALGGSVPGDFSEFHDLERGDEETYHGITAAGHAPHTMEAETLARLKQATRERGLPFSIHLAETPEEVEFIATGKGGWADLLSARNLRLSLKHSGLTPVAHVDALGVLDPGTVAVHLTFAGKEDLKILVDRGVHVCVCPRSNEGVTGTLPPLDAMISAGLSPCLGTDSLASSPSLDVFEEMCFTADRFPSLSPREITAMATVNGARALGAQHLFGDLMPGRAAEAVYLPIRADSPDALLERLVHGEAGRCERSGE